MPNDITPQIRLNAALSYLLLGPLFLLARHNPNLAHPHIRHHAKRSSQIIAGSLVYYLLFALLIHPLIREISLPLIHISLSSMLLMVSSFLIIFILLSSAYRVFSGGDERLMEDLKDAAFGRSEHRILSGEQEKISTLLSLVPIVSTHLFVQEQTREIARYGYILSSAFLTVFLCAFFSDPVSSWTFLLGALGIGVLSYLGICALFRGEQVGLEYIARIPTLQDIELSLVTLPSYLHQYLRSHSGDTTRVITPFAQMASDRYLSDQRYHQGQLSLYPHTQSPSKIAHIVAHLPGISLLTCYAAYRSSRESVFALTTSAWYGIVLLGAWYTDLGWLIGVSLSLLLIHIVRSYGQRDAHSMVVASLSRYIGRYMHSTHQRTRDITTQITRVEEKKY